MAFVYRTPPSQVEIVGGRGIGGLEVDSPPAAHRRSAFWALCSGVGFAVLGSGPKKAVGHVYPDSHIAFR